MSASACRPCVQLVTASRYRCAACFCCLGYSLCLYVSGAFVVAVTTFEVAQPHPFPPGSRQAQGAPGSGSPIADPARVSNMSAAFADNFWMWRSPPVSNLNPPARCMRVGDRKRLYSIERCRRTGCNLLPTSRPKAVSCQLSSAMNSRPTFVAEYRPMDSCGSGARIVGIAVS